MTTAPTAHPTARGYADRLPTKAPYWHGLVTLDILFNNLSTGLFLAAALGELAAPAAFHTLARAAYPMALLFLICDLICLVLDLGDPRRFHHMLRVWKPSSPMSLGTWCLTAYAVALTLLTLMSFVPGGTGFEWVRRLTIVAGLVLALAAAAYKGVLFSTSAQPGWRDARWLGNYLINSAMVLGAAELLSLATLMGAPKAVAMLRPALLLLLLLNLAALGLLLSDVRTTLSRVHAPPVLAGIGALVVLAGLLAPLGLLTLGAPAQAVGAVVLILLGAVVIRAEIVRLPHLLGGVRR
jgi:Ni/Fe-hydrogenase subunit HybB-like protein